MHVDDLANVELGRHGRKINYLFATSFYQVADRQDAQRRSIRVADPYATSGRVAAAAEDAYLVIPQALSFVVIGQLLDCLLADGNHKRLPWPSLKSARVRDFRAAGC